MMQAFIATGLTLMMCAGSVGQSITDAPRLAFSTDAADGYTVSAGGTAMISAAPDPGEADLKMFDSGCPPMSAKQVSDLLYRVTSRSRGGMISATGIETIDRIAACMAGPQ